MIQPKAHTANEKELRLTIQENRTKELAYTQSSIMTDKHPQGGSLADMAVDGTKVPSDAGTQRTIPSVPNPNQLAQDQSSGANMAAAADNATDIPRGNRDMGATSEVVTGKQKLLL